MKKIGIKNESFEVQTKLKLIKLRDAKDKEKSFKEIDEIY